MPTKMIDATPPSSADTTQQASTVSSRPAWLGALALVAAAFVAYHNSFSGVMLFDDRPSIIENQSIHDLGDLSRVLAPPLDTTTSGRPFANLTFAINYAFGGLNPWGYHALNLLIHIGAALGLFGVVRRSLLLPAVRERFAARATSIAVAAAILWTVHPLQTESVTYIVQRVEALAGLFYLLTLYCFIRSIDSDRTARWQVLAVGACVLGMASKEVVASAPLFVLLYDRTLVVGTFRAAWRQRRAFYCGLAATWLLLAVLIVSTENRAGTAGLGTASSWSYFLTQCHAIVHYLRLSLWPSPLVFDYGKTLVTDAFAVLPQALFLLALASVTLWGIWKRFCWSLLGAWFFALLAPTSSVVPVVTQTMAEHRMYLPLAAVILGLVFVGHRYLAPYARVAFAGLAILCIAFTVARNQDYHSALQLWTVTAAQQPNNPRALSSLGQSLFAVGKSEEAIANYEAALRIEPDHFEARNNLGIALIATGRAAEAEPHFAAAVRLEPDYAQAHSNLGMVLHSVGRTEEGLPEVMKAVELEPDYAESHSNLSILLNVLGRSEEAVKHGQEAVRLKPNYAEAHSNLGMALHALGRFSEAQTSFETALRLKPDFTAARSNLAKAFAALGRHDDAIATYRAVLEINPSSAGDHYGLGNTLLKLRRWSDALPHCAEAVRLEPAHAEARTNLGTVLFFTGQPDAAIAEFEAALKINPSSYKAHYFLGNVLAAQDRASDARAHYEHALRLNPDYAPAKQNLAQLANTGTSAAAVPQ